MAHTHTLSTITGSRDQRCRLAQLSVAYLGNTVVSLALVHEAIEDVVDGFTDEGTKRHIATIDSVQDGLEEIAFTGIF